MADIFVKAVSATHPDPEVDRAGCYKKGDIVEVRESGAPRGSLEGLPNFVIVECPEVTKAQVLSYMESWQTVLDWEVLGRSVPLDGWRLRLFNTQAGANVQAPVTRAEVEGWLNRWNATVQSVAPNSVVFDIGVYGAATSEAFWNRELDGLLFSELSYNQTTGLHRIRLDYSAVSGSEGVHGVVADTVLERGGGDIAQDEMAHAIDFSIYRDLVTTVFQQELKNALQHVHKRRRFSFPAAQVDNAVAAGGVIQATAAQLVAAVVDAMEV